MIIKKPLLSAVVSHDVIWFSTFYKLKFGDFVEFLLKPFSGVRGLENHSSTKDTTAFLTQYSPKSSTNYHRGADGRELENDGRF